MLPGPPIEPIQSPSNFRHSRRNKVKLECSIFHVTGKRTPEGPGLDRIVGSLVWLGLAVEGAGLIRQKKEFRMQAVGCVSECLLLGEVLGSAFDEMLLSW